MNCDIVLFYRRLWNHLPIFKTCNYVENVKTNVWQPNNMPKRVKFNSFLFIFVCWPSTPITPSINLGWVFWTSLYIVKAFCLLKFDHFRSWVVKKTWRIAEKVENEWWWLVEAWLVPLLLRLFNTLLMLPSLTREFFFLFSFLSYFPLFCFWINLVFWFFEWWNGRV